MSLHFIREIGRLNKHLIELSDMIEHQVSLSMQAISNLDEVKAQFVINADNEVDKAEIEMEEDCLKLLALYQPVANDLRQIIAVLKINNDLERIGDHAVIIAEEAIVLSKLPAISLPVEMFDLSKQAKMMLKKSLLAFVERDLHVAQDVLFLGQDTRHLAEKLFRNQLEQIKQVPEDVEQRLNVLKVCRQLQRVADHATNIAEDIIFSMSGEIIRHNSTV